MDVFVEAGIYSMLTDVMITLCTWLELRYSAIGYEDAGQSRQSW